MPQGRKPLMTAGTALEYLCSLTPNEVGWRQAPKGEYFLQFLQKNWGYKSILSVKKIIDELEEKGYLEKDFDKKKLFRVKLLKEKWEESELKIPVIKKVEPPQINDRPQIEKLRRFAIFIDYKNLADNLSRMDSRRENLSWLIEPVLDKGKISFGFIFLPDHYATRIPLAAFTYTYRFHVIICPKDRENGLAKDVDMVDARMIALAREILERCPEITDLIIVSGDGDFKELATWAKYQQKTVEIISPAKSLSSSFIDLKNSRFHVKTI